jgi:hypothetical protein
VASGVGDSGAERRWVSLCLGSFQHCLVDFKRKRVAKDGPD